MLMLTYKYHHFSVFDAVHPVFCGCSTNNNKTARNISGSINKLQVSVAVDITMSLAKRNTHRHTYKGTEAQTNTHTHLSFVIWHTFVMAMKLFVYGGMRRRVASCRTSKFPLSLPRAVLFKVTTSHPFSHTQITHTSCE